MLQPGILTTMGRSRGRTRSGTRKEGAREKTPLFFVGLLLWYAAIDNLKIQSRVSFVFHVGACGAMLKVSIGGASSPTNTLNGTKRQIVECLHTVKL